MSEFTSLSALFSKSIDQMSDEGLVDVNIFKEMGGYFKLKKNLRLGKPWNYTSIPTVFLTLDDDFISMFLSEKQVEQIDSVSMKEVIECRILVDGLFVDAGFRKYHFRPVVKKENGENVEHIMKDWFEAIQMRDLQGLYFRSVTKKVMDLMSNCWRVERSKLEAVRYVSELQDLNNEIKKENEQLLLKLKQNKSKKEYLRIKGQYETPSSKKANKSKRSYSMSQLNANDALALRMSQRISNLKKETIVLTNKSGFVLNDVFNRRRLMSTYEDDLLKEKRKLKDCINRVTKLSNAQNPNQIFTKVDLRGKGAFASVWKISRKSDGKIFTIEFHMYYTTTLCEPQNWHPDIFLEVDSLRIHPPNPNRKLSQSKPNKKQFVSNSPIIIPFNKVKDSTTITFIFPRWVMTNCAILLCIVKPISTSDLVDEIVSKSDERSLRSEITKKKKLGEINDDDEILEGEEVVVLCDPLLLTRIVEPARGIKCKHTQVFDLETYLGFCHQNSVWNCPICEKALTGKDLYIDRWIKRILSNVDESVEKVKLNMDNSYTPICPTSKLLGKSVKIFDVQGSQEEKISSPISKPQEIVPSTQTLPRISRPIQNPPMISNELLSGDGSEDNPWELE